jgi:ketosteroid isomerase-like protein
MTSRLQIGFVAISFALQFCASAQGARDQRKLVSGDQVQVVYAVSTMFDALRIEDVKKFDSVIAPGFYIFDGGIRLSRNAVIEFIKAQYAAGKRYEWNVTEPDVHIRGNTAWIAYVNRGSITDTSGTAKQSWMESAFLQKQAGIWKIAFLHSTRVPEAPRQNPAQ